MKMNEWYENIYATYIFLDVALHGTRVNFNAVFVDGVDHSIENVSLAWFEGDHVESHVEDNVACRILHHALQVIVLCIQVVSDDIDNVPKLLGTHTDKLLVYPIKGSSQNEQSRKLDSSQVS